MGSWACGWLPSRGGAAYLKRTSAPAGTRLLISGGGGVGVVGLIIWSWTDHESYPSIERLTSKIALEAVSFEMITGYLKVSWKPTFATFCDLLSLFLFFFTEFDHFQIPEAILRRMRQLPAKILLFCAESKNRSGPEDGRWFLQVSNSVHLFRLHTYRVHNPLLGTCIEGLKVDRGAPHMLSQ